MSCDLCQGTGWRIVDGVEHSHAERCSCFASRDRERRVRTSGIPPRYEHCELGSFEHHDPSQKRAHTVALRFVDRFPVIEGGLLMTGPVGVGKTHLAAAIVRELVLEKAVAARFVDFRELLKGIQASYNAVSETSEKEVLEPILSCELLVLDDLGAEKPSAWVRDTIAFILNDRYKRNRPVIITTNLPDDDPVEGKATKADDTLVDRIGRATRSRLHEMCRIVEIRGADYRTTFKRVAQNWTQVDE